MLAIIAGCAWLLFLVDDGLGVAWPQNAVRNWEQFGFFNLHGQLITNPGGYEATTDPQIYGGMSPVCLWLVYWATKLFGWTGLGTMSFHILLALAVFWAIWNLTGRDQLAFAIAAAAVLCPGYVRWQKILDPNTIPVLLSLPFATVVLDLLKKERLGLYACVGLFALTLGFTTLNWTTAWAYGLCALWLLCLPGVSRRRVLLFTALAGTSCILFAIASVIAKAGGGHARISGVNPVELMRGYMWGNTGYGLGMTTGKMLLRLSFVTAVGLLPLLLVLISLTVKQVNRANYRIWPAVPPFALGIAEVAIMRNYFGHHPWMAAPVLLVGLVYSLAVLRIHVASDTVSTPRPTAHARVSFLAGAIPFFAFLYCLAVLIFFRANAANELSLVNLVRHHTERSACIVIVKGLDPQTAQLAPRFDELLDRRVVIIDDLHHLPGNQGPVVILSSVTLKDSVTLLAQTSGNGTSPRPWLQATVDWFNHSIARRRAGDRLELGNSYYLYRPES